MAVDREARICIIGAGPAGMTAALTLQGLGYRRVTVLEKQARVGGKCRTEVVDGEALDTGAIYILPNYPLVNRLVEKAGLQVREAARYIHHGADGKTRPFGHTAPPTPVLTKAAEYARLGGQLVKHLDLLFRPIGEIDQVDPSTIQSLSLPFGDWVQRHRLSYFQSAAYPLMRSFGFGFEAQQIPAAYIFQALLFFARGGNPLALWNLAGVTLYHVEGGYGELWHRLAASLDVRLRADVRRVVRGEQGGSVFARIGDDAAEQEIPFDWLILACPLDRALSFLDASSDERELFSPIQSFPVWQLAVKAKGIPDAVLLDRNQAWSQLGHTMIFTRYRAGSPWYYLFGYAGPEQTDAALMTLARQTISELGGQLEGEPLLTRWDGYFPHYGSREVASGYHARIERLQGQRRTCYVGELLSGIGVEAASRYAQRFVERRFP